MLPLGSFARMDLHVAIAALHGKQLIGSILANDPSGNMNSLQQESSLNINT